MGWEIVSDKLTFTVKDTQLPKAFPVRGMTLPRKGDCVI